MMVQREEVLRALYRAIDEVNQSRDEDSRLSKTEAAPLVGGWRHATARVGSRSARAFVPLSIVRGFAGTTMGAEAPVKGRYTG